MPTLIFTGGNPGIPKSSRRKYKLSPKNKAQKTILLDFSIVKPKYGEILMIMQTLSILNALGFIPTLLIYSPKPEDGHLPYKKILNNDETMQNVDKDIESIITALGKHIRFRIERIRSIEKRNKAINDLSLSNSLLFQEQHRITTSPIMTDQKIKHGNIYPCNQQLLTLLIARYRHELNALETLWAIGDMLHVSAKMNGLCGQSRYLATNFRYNHSRPVKNGSPEAILKQAKIFYELNGTKTLVATEEEGHKLLLTYKDCNEYILFASPGNFIEDSKAVICADLLYQSQGGGISTWHLLSTRRQFFIAANAGHIMQYSSTKLFAHHLERKQIYIPNTSDMLRQYGKLAYEMAGNLK